MLPSSDHRHVLFTVPWVMRLPGRLGGGWTHPGISFWGRLRGGGCWIHVSWEFVLFFFWWWGEQFFLFLANELVFFFEMRSCVFFFQVAEIWETLGHMFGGRFWGDQT